MTAICIAVNWFYRIDRHAHARIQSELVTRRAVLVADKLPIPEVLP